MDRRNGSQSSLSAMTKTKSYHHHARRRKLRRLLLKEHHHAARASSQVTAKRISRNNLPLRNPSLNLRLGIQQSLEPALHLPKSILRTTARIRQPALSLKKPPRPPLYHPPPLKANQNRKQAPLPPKSLSWTMMMI